MLWEHPQSLSALSAASYLSSSARPRVDQAMCALIESRYPGASILVASPQTHELLFPDLGYVRRPLDAVRARRLPTQEGDLFVSAPWGAGRRVLRDYARARGWVLIERISEEGAVAELY